MDSRNESGGILSQTDISRSHTISSPRLIDRGSWNINTCPYMYHYVLHTTSIFRMRLPAERFVSVSMLLWQTPIQPISVLNERIEQCTFELFPSQYPTVPQRGKSSVVSTIQGGRSYCSCRKCTLHIFGHLKQHHRPSGVPASRVSHQLSHRFSDTLALQWMMAMKLHNCTRVR